MDIRLFKMVEQATPRFNRSVMRGLAMEQMSGVERYVDGLFRSITKSFPPGLTYEGCQRCTPQEEYNEISRKRSGKPTVDIARSDLFMMKYMFKYMGEDLDTRYMYLPYVRLGGIITIRGSTYTISPVLADRAISYGSNSIFIPVQVAKLTFERLDHSYLEYGATLSDLPDTTTTVSGSVAWATVYKRNEKKRDAVKPLVTAKHTIAHYLFCKYGVIDTFNRVSRTEVHIGYPEDVNYENYNREEWLICGSVGFCPRTCRVTAVAGGRRRYNPSTLRLVIRRNALSLVNQALIAAFFYVVDHFPDRITPEYVDNTRLWSILLGHLIFGSDQNEGKLAEEVNNHIVNLDEYLDENSRQDLHSVGIVVNDIYQLFGKTIEMLASMVLQSTNVEATMYDKELMVMRYALFDINKAISHFKFSLQKAVKKNKVKDEINKALQRNLGQDEITKINRQHGEVGGISSPGDNLYHKVTSNLVPQTSATGSGRGGKKSTLVDPAKQLHASIAEVGSYNNLPKSSPDGRTRINPCVTFDANYRVIQNERFKPLLDQVQRKIQRSK